MNVYYYNAIDQDIKGSSLVKALQDVGMPVIDVIVRESIQNSLDAGNPDDPSPTVRVEYCTGDFDCEALAAELPGVELAARKDVSGRYFSIRDRHTHGLRGDYLDPKSDLHKLVAGFMGNQNAEGAGGSWGLGKTVYYRLGIGLVIYYSRVRNDDGTLSSLLYAKMVENEDSPDAIIPPVNGIRYGIASWGEKIYPDQDNSPVRETRDESKIERVLAAFGFKKFGDEETGTAILIPFICEDDMLASNRTTEDSTGIPIVPTQWESSIDDYLAISVQRWYSARLNNPDYKKLYSNPEYVKDKILTVSVNGRPLGIDRQRNFSKLLWSLYCKAALTLAKDPKASEITYGDNAIFCEEIQLRRTIDRLEAGHVAFIRIKRTELDTDGCSFYRYVNLPEKPGTPIVVYCRKAGMIVNYETVSDWTSSLKSKCAEDEYIIGFFVLSPFAQLSKLKKKLSLDEYARRCETAAHNRWEKDKEIDPIFEPEKKNYQPNIFKHLCSQVGEKIGKAITPADPEAEGKKKIQSISRILGSQFPIFSTDRGGSSDDDPGQEGSKLDGSGSAGKGTRSTKGVSFSYEAKTNGEGLTMSIRAHTKKNRKANGISLELLVDSLHRPVSAKDWKKDIEMSFPFSFAQPSVCVMHLDGVKSQNPIDCKLTVDEIRTSTGEPYKVNVLFGDELEHEFDMTINIMILASRRDLKPIIDFDAK